MLTSKTMTPFYSKLCGTCKAHRSSFPLYILILSGLFASAGLSAQSGDWLDFQIETSARLTVSTVAESDPEEKDISVGDLNNDGFDDMIVVRKQPFSVPTAPARTDLLLINEGGVLVDRTTEFAPEFISNPTFARDLVIADFDDDGWLDVVVANTFEQQPLYYANLGNDINGDWLGLEDQSSTRFPVLTGDNILFCAVWHGDVSGNGAPDLYFSNYKLGGGSIAKDFLLINNGDGVFTDQSQTRLGNLRNSAFGTAVQLVDMDNDGDLDVVKVSTLFNVSPWNDTGVFVLFNNGSGNFTNWQNVAPFAPYMITIGDFDGNGFNDIFVVDDGGDYVIRVNGAVPNVSLTSTRQFVVNGSGGFGGNVHSMDLDLDGDLDIIVCDVDVDIPPCNSSREVHILQNNGGVFTQMYNTGFVAWATNSFDVGIIDINNDGLPDFVNGKCSGYDVVMNKSCDLAPNSSDYDGDGLADACDPCPANPNPDCAPPTDYPVVDISLPISRQWNDMLLASIRRDFARPPVHARNLFHLSVAMWDIWATYNGGCPFLLGQSNQGFESFFAPFPLPANTDEAFREAVSYASYRILNHRFQNSPLHILLEQGYNEHMDALGYDPSFTSVDYSAGSAAAFGNYMAQQIIEFGMVDGSNEVLNYANTAYQPVNPPLSVQDPGNPNILDINRWQPLTLQIFIDQSGNVIPGATPSFLSPEWGQVANFCLSGDDLVTFNRDDFDYKVFHNPGPPPYLLMDGSGTSEQFKWTFLTTLIWSSHLDPTDGVVWDISPASLGNRPNLPATFAEHPDFYDQLNGSSSNPGHPLNPITGLPYTPNMVPRADYTRVLAEFWADGPDSETPPGHWFSIFNYVTEHPMLERKIEGEGEIVSEDEWNVKGYLALGGAVHDVAVSVWGIKGWYDYTRPISAIRAMADLGQSSDPLLPSYHPAGLPLLPGYVELVQPGDPLAGLANVHVNKIKVKAWRGHTSINNVDTDIAGVDWILAERWVPYQRSSFVSPPFAGYVSGHSAFSRAAAEVLTAFTGDAYFPGGIGTFTAPANDYLVFESGPSVDVELQWATYRDAADESALSRIWGGIHPPADDIPARVVGIMTGIDAFNQSKQYFDDCAFGPEDYCQDAPSSLQASVLSNGVVLAWNSMPGTVGCRVEGNRIGGGGKRSIDIPVAGASGILVPNSQLAPNSSYRWRVICACQLNPLVTTPWSPYNFFSIGGQGLVQDESADENKSLSDVVVNIYPNPTRGEINVYTNMDQFQLEIFDLTGKTVRQVAPVNSPNTTMDLTGLASGTYFVRLWNDQVVETRYIVLE